MPPRCDDRREGDGRQLGLRDGKRSWFATGFTKKTGIKVRYIEGDSGSMVERLAKEQSNPQADALVNLLPFMQRAAATR